jgi:AcrR family transcriptional regulator
MSDQSHTSKAPVSARDRMVAAAMGLVAGEPTLGGPDTAVRRRATRKDARGAEALGIRAVAEAAGVTHAAPLHHFPDRVSLLAAVAAEGQRQLAGVLESAQQSARDRGARVLLVSLVQAHALWAARNPGVWDVMCNPQLTDDVTAVWRGRQEGRSAIAALAPERQPGNRGLSERALARRAEAFDELVDAKIRVFEAYDGAVQLCPAEQLRMDRFPGGDRRPLVHALTTVADGLALQFVGERGVADATLSEHVGRTLDLLLAGVLRNG